VPTLKDQEDALLQKRDEQVAKAGRARTILENPLLREALAAHEAGCVKAWMNSPPEDPAFRELLYRQLHAGRVFEAYLQRTIESGKVADVMASRVLPDGGDRTD
jgi:hypothetical protein